MNANEKRNKMAINSKDLPDDIYEVFKDKASKHALTSYIINLYRDGQRAELIINKLDSMDEKLNKLDIIEKKFDNISIEQSIDNNTEDAEKLEEGTIMQVGSVIGSFDDEDLNGDDF
jgi:hypothetical protein